MHRETQGGPNRAARLLAVVLLTLPIVGCKGKKPEKYRVGILGSPAFFEIAEGFKAKMAEFGYEEGKNICYDTWFLEANLEALGNRAIRKFVDEKVDLILAFPTEPAEVAKAGTAGTNIPVIFGFAGLEGNQLVESISHPGGNITGVRFTGPASTAKRLEILLEIVPRAKHIGIFYDPHYPNAAPSLEQCRVSLEGTDVELVTIPASDQPALKAALKKRDEMEDIGMDAILIMPDIVGHVGLPEIVTFAEKHALPIGGGQVCQAEQGALFGYSPFDKELGAGCAILADKVLRGSPAGNLPVASPENRLVLNYKRAQELGLTVPEGLLSLATKIIR